MEKSINKDIKLKIKEIIDLYSPREIDDEILTDLLLISGTKNKETNLLKEVNDLFFFGSESSFIEMLLQMAQQNIVAAKAIAQVGYLLSKNKEISEYLQTLHKEYIKAEQEAMTKSALESEVDYEEVTADEEE